VTGGGGVTSGGTEGTGLKFSSSGSGIPSAKVGANLATIKEAAQAVTAAITRNFIPILRHPFAGAFLMN